MHARTPRAYDYAVNLAGFVDRYDQAWNEQDVDAIMSMHTSGHGVRELHPRGPGRGSGGRARLDFRECSPAYFSDLTLHLTRGAGGITDIPHLSSSSPTPSPATDADSRSADDHTQQLTNSAQKECQYVR